MIDLFCTNGSSPPRTHVCRPDPDLLISGGGSVYLLHPTSPAGHTWIEEHISPVAPRLGTAVAVEHRFILNFLLGAIRDGLAVR